MHDYLQEYKTYYQLRMERYENNPDYTHSYRSEKNIYEAINSCNQLEEFKDRLGHLNEINAVALVMDEYQLRLRHYQELQQPIWVSGCQRILAAASQISQVAELITRVTSEQNRISLELTTDSIAPFDNLAYLERIELWREAEVPEKYQKKYQQYAEEEVIRYQQAFQTQEQAMQQWQPGWVFDFERIREDRHRRLLPIPDEVLHQYCQTAQSVYHAR